MNVKPTRKIGATGAGGGLAIILIWAAQEFGGVVIPAEVGAAIAAVLGTISGWLTRD